MIETQTSQIIIGSPKNTPASRGGGSWENVNKFETESGGGLS